MKELKTMVLAMVLVTGMWTAAAQDTNAIPMDHNGGTIIYGLDGSTNSVNEPCCGDSLRTEWWIDEPQKWVGETWNLYGHIETTSGGTNRWADYNNNTNQTKSSVGFKLYGWTGAGTNSTNWFLLTGPRITNLPPALTVITSQREPVVVKGTNGWTISFPDAPAPNDRGMTVGEAINLGWLMFQYGGSAASGIARRNPDMDDQAMILRKAREAFDASPEAQQKVRELLLKR